MVTRGNTTVSIKRCELNPRRRQYESGCSNGGTPAYLRQCLCDSCKVEAGSKKLAGAAMTSFMKKCQTDATAACDKSAAEKKLSGAAKTSFTKKCVGDAVGS